MALEESEGDLEADSFVNSKEPDVLLSQGLIDATNVAS